jgi:hypothetical protein
MEGIELHITPTERMSDGRKRSERNHPFLFAADRPTDATVISGNSPLSMCLREKYPFLRSGRSDLIAKASIALLVAGFRSDRTHRPKEMSDRRRSELSPPV